MFRSHEVRGRIQTRARRATVLGWMYGLFRGLGRRVGPRRERTLLERPDRPSYMNQTDCWILDLIVPALHSSASLPHMSLCNVVYPLPADIQLGVCPTDTSESLTPCWMSCKFKMPAMKDNVRIWELMIGPSLPLIISATSTAPVGQNTEG